MKIIDTRYYDGAREKIERLGLAPVFEELLTTLRETDVRLEEKKDMNSGKAVRITIDNELSKKEDWVKTTTGDIDWMKSMRINGITIRIGVEIQVSARSDLVIRDLLHMRENMKKGITDTVVLVVPSDRMSKFLPDRAPSLAETLRYIEQEFNEIQQFPFVLVAVEHDGTGKALPKQKRVS